MSALNKEFDNQLAGIAWSLWRELGVAGTDRFHENCLIQPEELIILTAIVSEYDPRLRDEALDWASCYHEYISVSRLRSLLKELDDNEQRSFSQFAAALNSISSAKWPSAEESPRFKVKISGKSSLPVLKSPSLLMLRLRNLFGPGAKADILTHFLTRNEMRFSAADLVEIGYSKRSLMTALDHLAASRVLDVENAGNKKIYQLRNPKELQVVIGQLPKVAPSWNKILQAIIAIRSVISEIQNSSEVTKSVIFRNCLIKIEDLLPTFISPILHTSPDFRRDWNSVMEILNGFRQGNFFMQFEVYNEFEKIIMDLLPGLYRVDDCVDGIERIQEKVLEFKRHEEVYKECYQLFLSFARDLEVVVKQFLNFPFHKMMDESLADIVYRFSKEEFSLLLEKIWQIKPIDQITSVQLAINQYQMFMPQFHILKQFIYTFRKRLENLYFIETDIHLLSQSTTLYKRHLVIDLFSTRRELES